MAFDEIVFPDGIDYGLTGGPEFLTIVQEGYTGHEQRLSSWSEERCSWNLSKTLQTPAEILAVEAFFRARKGKARGFRFKSPSNYQLTAENIGTGTGALLIFQAKKTYNDTLLTYVKTIYKIATGTLLVYVNGVLKTLGANPGGDYTANLNTGVITFNAGKAPAAASAVTITCDFHYPVRFDTDKLDVSFDFNEILSVNSLPIIEIRDIS